MTETEAAIIGGGVSGLSTAFYLQKEGIRSVLFEKSERSGGLIRTHRVEGCELEAGPDSFIAAKPSVVELAKELGIGSEVVGSNDEKRQIFIVRNGNLVPMPKGMVMMVPTEWEPVLSSPLFSENTKSRFLAETSRQPHERSGDFSIRDFVLDHFDEESLTYITEPLLSGVYGGDAAQLSARSVLPRFVEYEQKYGSLIKAAQEERSGTDRTQSFFLSFRGGMQTLTDTLTESLGKDCCRLRAEVSAIKPGKDGWRLQTSSEETVASNVILACPAHAAGRLLAELDPALSSELGAVPYSSAILVTLLYRRELFDHPLDGFGFLVPRPERKTIAAATWINTKFPSRVAPGLVAVRAFIVDPQADFYLKTPEVEIISSVLADLKHFMRIGAHPVYSKVAPWPCSMPQYVVGHAERCRRIHSLLEKHGGLHLVSNYLDGVGIPDCVRLARKTAHRLQTSCAKSLL